MKEKNRFGLTRAIPEAVKRKVRQRCGFGCVVCGSAIIDYEHLEPEFKDAQEHSPDGIILLCPTHHRQKGNFLSRDTIAEAAKNPASRKSGFARGPFDVGNSYPEIVLGTFIGRSVPVLIRVMGEDVFTIKPPEESGGPFRLSAILRDTDGKVSFRIVDNEWQIPDIAWDAAVVGPRITIRRNMREIALVLRSEPPNRVVVERLEMDYRGLRLSCREGHSLTVDAQGNVIEAQSMTVDGCTVGIEVMPNYSIRVGVGGGNVSIGRMEINQNNHPLAQQFKLGRNTPCHCGSGIKFKKCHGRDF